MNTRSGTAHQDKEPDPTDLKVADPTGAGSDPAVQRHHVCLAADDFGLHAGICSAALQLAAAGRVHAIGCMVGAAAWTTWQPMLAQVDPHGVDVGLHLDLTERPLTMPPQGLKRLITASLLRRIDRAAIRREIGAQLDTFEQAMGRRPDFVDGHQHVHQLPVVRDALVDLLVDRYGTDLPWLRATRAGVGRPGQPTGKAGLAIVKPRIIQALGAGGLAARARRSGILQNHHLWGVYDFGGDCSAYLDRMNAWLHACHTGDLIMCHPGMMRHASNRLAKARWNEYQALCSTRFVSLLQQHAIVLEPMSRILARRVAACVHAPNPPRVAGRSPRP